MLKTNEIKGIEKDIYNKLIGEINIEGIYLKRLITSDTELVKDDNISAKVDLKYNCNDYRIIDKDFIEFYPKFKIEITIKDTSPILIQFEFRVLYKLKDISKYNNNYIDLFMSRNVPINVWPYAREIISSITTRMGYPPLIINAFKG